MSGEITTNKSFEEKIEGRIKESIGEFIDDEALSRIVHKAIDKILFDPILEKNSYGRVIKETPSFLYVLIKELLETKVKMAIKDYINNHKDDVNKIIERVISDGAGKLLIRSINNEFHNELDRFRNDLMNHVNEYHLH